MSYFRQQHRLLLTSVCIQAVALGYPEAQAWIENNTEAYVEEIFTGFEIED